MRVAKKQSDRGQGQRRVSSRRVEYVISSNHHSPTSRLPEVAPVSSPYGPNAYGYPAVFPQGPLYSGYGYMGDQYPQPIQHYMPYWTGSPSPYTPRTGHAEQITIGYTSPIFGGFQYIGPEYYNVQHAMPQNPGYYSQSADAGRSNFCHDDRSATPTPADPVAVVASSEVQRATTNFPSLENEYNATS